MLGPKISSLALATASASVAVGQAYWAANQVSTSICQWRQLRAAVVRDTVYLDGGDLWWKPGLSNGEFGAATLDNNPLGITWKLNFSKPFDTTGNITEKFDKLYGNAGGPAANIAPNYLDGALLYNNDGWFYYGGMLQKTGALADPPGDRVRGYRAYSSKVDNLQPQFVDEVLDRGLTRYVAYGGAASAPSENMAWYFSGLRAPSSGPVYVPGSAKDGQATVVVDSMITLDMTTQQKEDWNFKNLTGGVPGRANPELVWVPVGSRGILVALGGVVDPDFINVTTRSNDPENNKAKSPGFMSTIDIYDVAGDKWYRQNTTGGPGALTRGCAVVASAQDGSSFNIYYYGGYDGLRQRDRAGYSDDVWVLSLPSFTWVKLYSGTGQPRAGHKCVMPYPDQMMVIGGYPPLQELNTLRCLDETIRVFNLTTGKWVNRYDPTVWSKYAVPDAVVKEIGGSPTGGATKTTPSPSFAPSLSAVFATPYPTTKIQTFYPYPLAVAVNNTNPNVDPHENNNGGGGGLPSYLPPVLGVVLGLVLLTVIAVLVLLWRRRKYFKKNGASEVGTEDTNGHRIMNWIRNQPHPPPPEVKAPTVASTEYIPSSNTDVESVGFVPQMTIVEMMNTEIKRPIEMPDTSPPAELHDVPLTHGNVINSHSHLGETPVLGRGANNGSLYSGGTNQIDHANTIFHPVSSSGAAPPRPPPPPKDSPVTSYRPDSDALGNPISVGATPTSATGAGTHSTLRQNVLSGISNLSERDRSHLRQISDTTVSSVTSGHAQIPNADGRILSPAVVESPSLVTPPSSGAQGAEGMDYLSARPIAGQNNNLGAAAASSPLRRSAFTESREDMVDPNAGSRQNHPQ